MFDVFFTLYCYFNSLLYFPGTFFFILLVLHVIQNIIGVIFTPTPDFLLINEIYIYIFKEEGDGMAHFIERFWSVTLKIE